MDRSPYSTESSANASQIEFWNGAMGGKWAEMRKQFDAMLRPLGEVTLARAALRPGHRAIDIGCGCGDSAAEIARRVAPGGSVTGIDISEVMLAEARRRPVPESAILRFERADAAHHDFRDAGADRLFSRFGVMFFAEPERAFANLRRAHAPTGQLTFICWGDPDDNPWMKVPVEIAARHVPPPDPPPPGAPGPFAFGSAARIAAILEAAGWSDFVIDRHDQDILLGGGGGVENAVSFFLSQSRAGSLGSAAPAVRAAVTRDLTAALSAYAGPEGVRMPSSSWIVTAVPAS